MASGKPEIVRLGAHTEFEYEKLLLGNSTATPRFPVAVEADFDTAAFPLNQTAFTFHGAADDPLEAQCAQHLRKVVLDEETIDRAQELLMSMAWLTSV